MSANDRSADDRIDLDDEASVRFWSEQFGLTADELAAFVREAGADPAVIRRRIVGRERPAPHPEETYPRPTPGNEKGIG